MPSRRLIVNADDFGFTRDVNAGIVHAHREGILTSTTLMANGDAFHDALALARTTPTLDIGCHLVLVQGKSVLNHRPLPETPRDLLASLWEKKLDVYAELRAQIENIVAAGIRPTHVDTHKHTHIVPHIFRIVARLAAEFDIPYVRLPVASFFRVFYLGQIRKHRRRVTDHFLGYRLTGSLDEATLAQALRKLPPGSTEFMCHPGYLGKDLARAATRLKASRAKELEALTSPRIRQLLIEREVRWGPFLRPEDSPSPSGPPSS